ncbi:hypothetical protein K469DRAFT_684023 [Zopfia rhizophila CBS 207.26]|uniref:Uncharacterized protein n=1 Tax=Zopfia rhizophila CBS 207.26 TaxID=1314779 RepID=A0A6A6DBJ7_9PEZI|nr:hypothetical protein K469DRAFT_684023 [Zopfia rhizophila CBS 207.26]
MTRISTYITGPCGHTRFAVYWQTITWGIFTVVFMATFEREERSFRKDDVLHTQIMRKGWEIGNFWYFSTLDCLNGLYSLYMSHIQRIFAPLEDSGPEFDRTVSTYWTPNTVEFITTKLRDKELYSSQLRDRFAAELNNLEIDDGATGEKDDTAIEDGDINL